MADEQPGDNARACPPWCVVRHDGQHALDDLVHEGDPERTGQTTPATHAAGETDAASPEESDPTDRPTNRSEAGAAGQQTNRRGAGATGHHAAHPLVSTPSAGPVLTQDPEQRSTAATILSFPFDQLASPALHCIAHQHSQKTASSQRKTPTHEGERTSSTEASDTPEASASTATRHAGSYSSTVVRLGTLNTNNWAPLLRFRDQLILAERMAPGDLTHDDTLKALATTEPPILASHGAHEQGSESTGGTAREPGDTVHHIRKPHHRPLSSQSREQIRRLADSGLSAREAAARHGVHEGTVRAIWREQHRSPRRSHHRFSEEDRQRAEQMLSQGMTLIEVGLELGFDRSTVRRHLNKLRHAN